MDRKISICLYRSQWHCLRPHLPGILRNISPEPPLLVFDCIACNEAVYQQILDAAQKHCPDLVELIEKEKGRSLRELSHRKRRKAFKLFIVLLSIPLEISSGGWFDYVLFW